METISATEGDRADFPRLGTRYLLRGEATGGRFALIEHEIPPRALAAPTHHAPARGRVLIRARGPRGGADR